MMKCTVDNKFRGIVLGVVFDQKFGDFKCIVLFGDGSIEAHSVLNIKVDEEFYNHLADLSTTELLNFSLSQFKS